MNKCRSAGSAFHTTLLEEMKPKADELTAKSREVSDAEDDLVGAGADSEAAEEEFEDLIRNTDGDLARLDRKDGLLNAQATIFPDGFGAEIEPDGEKQLDVLPALKTRFAAFKGQPVIVAALAEIEAAEVKLRAAFAAEDAADEKVETLFAEEQEARRHVREQLDSAYGRLRDYYKGRPGRAERFFQKQGKGGRGEKDKDKDKDKDKKKAPGEAAAAPVAAPGGGTPVAAPGASPSGGGSSSGGAP